MKKRIVLEKMQKHTEAYSVDNPGHGNANHEYEIQRKKPANDGPLCFIAFQTGPIKENGVNGIFNEDLISIVIDRLKCFQTSEYKCHENDMAIIKLEEALMWLSKRTLDRERRNVLGTCEI